MSIKVNDKVKIANATDCITDQFRNEVGKVLRLYDFTGPVAIVGFDNGMSIKVPVSNLIKVEDKENQGEVKPEDPEIPEGAKKISKVDFMAAIREVCTSAMSGNFHNPMNGVIGPMVGTIVGDQVGEMIFSEADVIVITKDELIVALWNGCNPEQVSKSTDGEFSVSRALAVSVTAIITLRKVADILFNDHA